MKLPVFRAIGQTYSFVFSNLFKFIFVPLAAGLVGAEIVNRLGIDLQADLQDVVSTLQAYFAALNTGNPAMVGQSFTALINAAWPLLAAQTVLTAVLFTGGLRFALRQSDGISFNLGRDELLVMLTWIIIGAVNIVIIVGASFAVGFVAGAMPGSPVAGVIIIVVAVLALIFFLWFGLRTSLAAPAAVDGHTLGVAGSFRASKSNVWRLLAFWVLILLTSLIVNAIVGGAFGAAWQAISHKPGATPQLFLASMVLGFILQQAIFIAAGGAAYRLLNPAPA